jgi:8-oxo-dGTP pyrophosphatase MutT (NUDIX family)
LREEDAAGFTLHRLRRLTGRLVSYDWDWARENAGWIAEGWARRVAERPGLFDGPVLLACGLALSEGACEARFFETTYARFIAFRDAGERDGPVANAFAAIVPRTRDGAVLLGEMGSHTANAGQIYFPCGTPDRADLRGTQVDLAGSAVRELREETGLSLPDDASGEWLLLRGEGQLAFLRPVAFPEDAEALRARMEAHRTGEAEPELSRILIARTLSDIDSGRMPRFVRAYLAQAFAPQIFARQACGAGVSDCRLRIAVAGLGGGEQVQRLALATGRAGRRGMVQIGAEACADGLVEVAGGDVAVDHGPGPGNGGAAARPLRQRRDGGGRGGRDGRGARLRLAGAEKAGGDEGGEGEAQALRCQGWHPGFTARRGYGAARGEAWRRRGCAGPPPAGQSVPATCAPPRGTRGGGRSGLRRPTRAYSTAFSLVVVTWA